ncbi:MAG: tetratricopeptide repeat protein [Calditrichaeota bacterium]|nr:MAG: tetratricopeptide repeat protein [Calditrichota bacterium]
MTGKLTRAPLWLILGWLAIALGSSFALADEPDALFVRGNQAYQDGDYRAAIAAYEQIANLGYESWELYYNLGNAYFKDHQLAKAILNFERAKRLNPESDDIEFNLQLARLSTVDRIQELPQFFLSAWWGKLEHLLSLQTLTVLTLAFYLLFMLFLAFRVLLKAFRHSRLARTALFTAGVLLVFSATLLASRVYEEETREEAIVVAQKVDVKSAPDEAGTDVFTLHEGVKVQIKDRSLDWVKIRLADGKVGWLPAADLEVI